MIAFWYVLPGRSMEGSVVHFKKGINKPQKPMNSLFAGLHLLNKAMAGYQVETGNY